MNLPGGSPSRACFAAPSPAFSHSPCPRHGTCIAPVFLDKNSQSHNESVDCRGPLAKSDGSCGCCFLDARLEPRNPASLRCDGCHERLCKRRWIVGRLTIVWNHGAARYGHRKRTCVRVACGGAERPFGEGNHSTHGPSGRFVVRWENIPPAVFSPDCEDLLRQRHFSRGPGLLAALTASEAVSPPIGIGLHRMSRHEKVALQATRPPGPAVISAASSSRTPPERPAAGRGAHNPGPRTRLRMG